MTETTKSQPLIFLTDNQSKIKEFSSFFSKEGIIFETLHNLEPELCDKTKNLTEIQSVNVETVSIDKLKQAYQLLKRPCFIEDTGLYFDDIPTRYPGALIKFLYKAHGNDGITKIYGGLKATAETVISLTYDGVNIISFKGQRCGFVADEPKGTNGFAWDQIFAVPTSTLDKYRETTRISEYLESTTYAQMTDDEKEIISHRSNAMKKMLEYLIANKL